MNATNLDTTALRNRSTLTFVGFATWLEPYPASEGCHIEVWRDAIGRLFAWTTNAHGQVTVNEIAAS